MKWFKKMIRTIADKGIVVEGLNPHTSNLFSQYVIEKAPEVEVFLFEHVEQRDEDDIIDNKQEWEPIDLPFPLTAFEINQIYEDADIALFRQPHKSSGRELEIFTYCMLIIEINSEVLREHLDENHSLALFLCIDKNDKNENWVVMGEFDSTYWSTIVNFYLNRINRGFVGISEIRDKVTIRKKGEKKKRHIKLDRQFIVVDNKKARTKYENTTIKGRSTVNWNHSVNVRGHWRHFPDKEGFMGLNRDGKRVVPGKTWIKHFTKGDQLPSVKKPRVVK